MERFTYRALIAYSGSAFAGFARQPGQKTVEGTLVLALRALVPELEGVSVGGRTDRGVHAVGQVISFWSRQAIDPGAIEEAIDRAAPGELVAREVRWVPRRFHAQHSARLRRYAYFLRDEGELDAVRLDRLLFALIGRRDFGAFARDTIPSAKQVRRLNEAGAVRIDRSTIRLDFAADGFLRRQVRVMVATAVRELQLGSGDDALVSIAERGERGRTAQPADPDGLVLTAVCYDPVVSWSRRGQLEQPPLRR